MAAAAPHAFAITCESRSVTRGDLERRSNRLARAYEQLGVQEGDFVTIALRTVSSSQATLATWKPGAVPAPVSPKLPRRELAAPARLVGGPTEVALGRVCVPEGFEPDPSPEPRPDRAGPGPSVVEGADVRREHRAAQAHREGCAGRDGAECAAQRARQRATATSAWKR